MTEISRDRLDAAPTDEWRTYDEFAAGIDTFRLPSADLAGEALAIDLEGERHWTLDFIDAVTVAWTDEEPGRASMRVLDPYDAVRVRDDVLFINLPFTSSHRRSMTFVVSMRTNRAIAVSSVIADEHEDGLPQVAQEFWSGVLAGSQPSGPEPGPTRDLIGKRNVYRYSPSHLYEHAYMSTERYMWQCLQGVQRGHGDVDLSTVWKFDHGLYLFCFREFKIAVASVWLPDLGYALRTTGIFLGLDSKGESSHSRAGGHIYPLGSVSYPDVQPI
jgi:hypothetical protein